MIIGKWMRSLPALALLTLWASPVLAQVASLPDAPAIELEDLQGKTWSSADHEDEVVVLEWTNRRCPYVVRHYKARTMQDLAARYAQKGVVWVSIDSSRFAHREVRQLQAWKKQQEVSYPILLDPTGDVGRAYSAKTTPHMYIVKGGKILYQGAIDDAPRGRAKVNYVEKALDEILAGKPVSEPMTKPYGCSVKYAKKRDMPGAAEAGVWQTDWKKALSLARKTRRPLLVNFTGSDWCGWCVKLKNEVFSKPEFEKWAAANVVLVELDFPRSKPQSDAIKKQNAELRDHFKIRGYPTILFVGADGKAMARSGYMRGGPQAWIEDAKKKLGGR